jgi:hypothetical protein
VLVKTGLGKTGRAGAWVPVVAGFGVAVTLGVYGRVHHPPGAAVELAGLLRPQSAKVWLATGVAGLAVLQLLSALAMYDRLPRVPPAAWQATLHRWSGRSAFVLSVPVAVHCLYVLGFQSGEPRVLIHSLCGCLFYGAFVAKMLIIGRPGGGSGWAIPVAGGVVFTAITGLWLTSALWFFTH